MRENLREGKPTGATPSVRHGVDALSDPNTCFREVQGNEGPRCNAVLALPALLESGITGSSLQVQSRPLQSQQAFPDTEARGRRLQYPTSSKGYLELLVARTTCRGETGGSDPKSSGTQKPGPGGYNTQRAPVDVSCPSSLVSYLNECPRETLVPRWERRRWRILTSPRCGQSSAGFSACHLSSAPIATSAVGR